jgi:hypothetical protein
MVKNLTRALLLPAVLAAYAAPGGPPRIVISENHRWLQTANGQPFFWLADTGWLLFQKLDREATIRYLENRQKKGFNVIQAMVLHARNDVNAYGAAALTAGDPARPRVTDSEHGYWNHIDWVIGEAAARGIYIALVPAWGALVSGHALTEANVESYARFLAERYRRHSNVFWITGGDIRADRNLEVWRKMGRTIRAVDPDHVITYHPFGRTSSSEWYHAEPWLDFNMFQSGHRDYAQEESAPGAKGEDNWRYVEEDYARTPAKPVLDGEPSYEGIPHGLHDITQPLWQAADCRRYAYWSVFAGAFGHTYGNNSVMQMALPGNANRAYGATKVWHEAIDDPGAGQMQYLKGLILSRPYFERVAAQDLIAGDVGARYERILATRGRSYAMFYTYTGRAFAVKMGVISGATVRMSWYDPRTGAVRPAGTAINRGERTFTPPASGQDWVLVLDDETAGFGPPGTEAPQK